jgi:hypothetical protein
MGNQNTQTSANVGANANVVYQSPNLTVTSGQSFTTTWTLNAGTSLTVPNTGTAVNTTYQPTVYYPSQGTAISWPSTSPFIQWIPSPMDVKVFLDDVRKRKDKLTSDEVKMIKGLLEQIKKLYLEII